ncbi:arginyltransferase [Labrys sp. LIt4]|uniref:Aspartate/glutamate leucyltransferase n=1 Tax=Labrys okinawensis TaxID=346911 RepID=A0A2S9QCL2_9HYPH|nr:MULTISPECIES: arginyltransferase [Labrys]MBP0579208.1 arginyltransferase [Labrys sp. LIt4]PRH87086.1 arginyltransferase [Labrys okinawensis]
MSIEIRDSPQFYLTAPSPCPYLKGKQERKVFTHLIGERAARLNDVLSHGGFRRSQTIAYRPACENCKACVSVRVPVADFIRTKSFRRVLADNRDVVSQMRGAAPTSEQYSTFRAYLDQRHADGGMADMTVLDYAMMVEDTHVNTQLVEYRLSGAGLPLNRQGEGPLIGVSLTDVLADGLSMVYSFYEPAMAGRSVGTFMILDHIARTQAMGLPYLYLGYWVEGSRKMAYKGRFLPQERLGPNGWDRVEK